MPDYSASVLYQRYRTITFQNANSEGFDQAYREIDVTFGLLLPADLNARILDVGCGMGHFLSYLKAKGYRNISGIDVSQEQVQYCQDHLPCEVSQADTLSFLEQSVSSWDCIAMKDVIEHIPRNEVIPTLAAIFSHLNEGGTVIVETGNMASATGIYLRNIDFTHESGFTEVSLKQVLLGSGFQKVEITGQSHVMRGWRSYILRAMRSAWRQVLRLIYFIERGGDGIPKVLSTHLIAKASKSNSVPYQPSAVVPSCLGCGAFICICIQR